MKKLMTVCMMFLLVLGVFDTAVAAQDAATPKVYVSIADANGTPVVAHLAVDLGSADANADGKITVDEVLRAAHEEKYPGGAAAGYASVESEWGVSLTKLWGTENGGSYGYYVNNTAAMSLSDEVKQGDYVYAYVYRDLETWSDTYCYFDVETVSVRAGESVTLTLTSVGFDAEYQPVHTPLANAVITLNGQKTDLRTDADGKATVTLKDSGSILISAVDDGKVLVPPVCVAEVAALQTTSNRTMEVLICLFAVVAVAGVIGWILIYKKKRT